jgi:hypothetical protein
MKKTYLILIVCLIILLAIIFSFLFLIDIGINSKFFIKKDLNNAFNYLLSGDCASFSNYSYNKNSEDACRSLINSASANIKDFEIKNLSHKFGSKEAFLNVELTYIENGKDKTLMVNIKMKKDNLVWKILSKDN